MEPRAPLSGIENSGWKLSYNATRPDLLKAREDRDKTADLMYSIGLVAKEDGTITDVAFDGPARKALIAPSAS